MNQIAENIIRLKSILGEEVALVAVSKTKPVDTIMQAYECGQRIFGENRVQELADKQPQLPPDIEWHMIGHLQRNKVKSIAGFVSLIHSVDSLRLLETINGEALKAGRVIRCLLQFHIASEETKFGLDMDEAEEIIRSVNTNGLDNVDIAGVMGMATYTDDHEQVRKEFRYLKHCFDQLKVTFFNDKTGFSIVSMGMSGDYMIAVEEGSNMVRIGSHIFGERIKV